MYQQDSSTFKATSSTYHYAYSPRIPLDVQSLEKQLESLMADAQSSYENWLKMKEKIQKLIEIKTIN